MTQDEIIELARQTSSHGVEHRSGEVSFVFYNEHLEAFAKLVAAAAASKEREACTKVCDNNQYVYPYHDLSTLIRARRDEVTYGEPTSRGEA